MQLPTSLIPILYLLKQPGRILVSGSIISTLLFVSSSYSALIFADLYAKKSPHRIHFALSWVVGRLNCVSDLLTEWPLKPVIFSSCRRLDATQKNCRLLTQPRHLLIIPIGARDRPLPLSHSKPKIMKQSIRIGMMAGLMFGGLLLQIAARRWPHTELEVYLAGYVDDGGANYSVAFEKRKT